MQRSITNIIKSPFVFFINLFVLLFLIIFLLVINLIEKILTPIAKLFGTEDTMFKKKITSFFDKNILRNIQREDNIPKMEIVDIALKNIFSKKVRTAVTIGGMAIGIGTIVFLVSTGYGIQNLIISQFAVSNELRQFEVFPRRGGKFMLDDTFITKVSEQKGLEKVMPVISVATKVQGTGAVSDVPAYAVQKTYLDNTNLKLVKGAFYTNDEINLTETVKGASTSVVEDQTKGNQLWEVDFALMPNVWIPVYESPDTNSKVLGYTNRVEDLQRGKKVMGAPYDLKNGSSTVKSNDWISSSLLLWKAPICKVQKNCKATYTPILGTDKKQTSTPGYITMESVVGELPTQTKSVLGASDSVVQTPVDLINIDDPNAVSAQDTKKVTIPADTLKEVVVSRALLRLVNLTEDSAVGKSINVSFIISKEQIKDATNKIETEFSNFVIKGVTSDDTEAIIYVPLIDMKKLGVTYYTNLKVNASTPDTLSTVRETVESYGYVTTSVVDIVKQINSTFSTVRYILLAIGMLALLIASLGMFNTLTISLLERTREIGLLKAIGMNKDDVRDLFLVESLSMGILGGLLGTGLGYALGKFVSIALGLVGIVKTNTMLDLTYIPIELVLFITILSLIVGVLTGMYPARRAQKISALHALRYE
ncbi:MAG: FtsX-like permease family protein [bacterium]